MSAAINENTSLSVPTINEPSMSGGLQDKRRQQGTLEQHGLVTPEPDEERNNFERARLQAANQSTAENTSTQLNDAANESESDSESEVFDVALEQVTAVIEVMKCDPKEYHKILGAKDTHETKEQEREDIVNAFRKRGALTHENFNKHKDAKKAFKSKDYFYLYFYTLN